ncbi:MAG: hypothetical protein WAU65_02605 [Candidatus Nanoarchaeia archaeon]
MKDFNLKARVLAGSLAIGALIPPVFNYIEGLQSPQEPNVRKVDSSLENKTKNQNDSYAIIVNGVGNPHFYSEQGQRDSVQSAFEAYNILTSKIKSENVKLFLSNPYQIKVPENVKIEGPATKENLFDTLTKDSKKGKLYLVLIEAPCKNPMELDSASKYGENSQDITLEDGIVSSSDLCGALYLEEKGAVLISDMSDSFFIRGLGTQTSNQFWGMDRKGPKNLLALELNFYDSKGKPSLSEISQKYTKNPNQSIQSLVEPYSIIETSFNEYGLETSALQDLKYKNSLFADSKEE